MSIIAGTALPTASSAIALICPEFNGFQRRRDHCDGVRSPRWKALHHH